MLKKIKIKKKNLMYIVIGVLLVITIAIWIFIIRRSAREEQVEMERIESEREELRQLEEESGYADAKTRPLTNFEDPLGDVEAMLKVGEQQEDIKEKYPWYYDLPIENDDFIILWDWDKEKFRIALKIKRDTTESIRERLIEQAVSEIEDLTEAEIGAGDYYIMLVYQN